jgi:hypothetical protein
MMITMLQREQELCKVDLNPDKVKTSYHDLKSFESCARRWRHHGRKDHHMIAASWNGLEEDVAV